MDVARLLILEDAADRAGIVISDADLAEHLRALLDQRYEGQVATYKAIADSLGGAAAVEGILRRALRARRYLDLQSHIAQVPDPDKIAELWNTDHRELAFDYVELETASFAEEASAALPDDEALAAWWEEQPESTRLTLRSPEERAAAFVSFLSPEETPAQGLVEAYPRPAELTPEELSEDYYNRVYTSRFRRPAEPETPEDGEGEEGAEDGAAEEEGPEPPAQELFEYYSPDEVKEQTAAEAAIFFALEDWLTDLSSRQSAGEDIDLAAEAEQYGLRYELTESKTRADLTTELDERGATGLANLVFQTLPETFYPFPFVNEDSLTVVFVDSRTEPGIPPIEEIRDEVLEKWTQEKQKELAEAKLVALRDSFDELVLDEEEAEEDEGEEDELEDEESDEPEEPEVVRRSADENVFRTAVEAAGLTVARRDWLDKRATNPNADPLKDESAHQFLRGRPDFNELETGEVAEVSLDRTGEYAYLVRLAGSREVPIDQMGPREYNSYKLRSASETGRYVQQALTDELLRERYSLWLEADEIEDPDEFEDEFEDEDLDDEE